MDDETERGIRRTAAEGSLKEAQRQFEEALAGVYRKIMLWGIFSALGLLALFGVIVWLAYLPLRADWGWHGAWRLGMFGRVEAIVLWRVQTVSLDQTDLGRKIKPLHLTQITSFL